MHQFLEIYQNFMITQLVPNLFRLLQITNQIAPGMATRAREGFAEFKILYAKFGNATELKCRGASDNVEDIESVGGY